VIKRQIALAPIRQVGDNMTNILQFVGPTSTFDPTTLIILGDAFDRARASLHETGQPSVVYEIMAGRIMVAAMNGELDPEKLCQIATRGICLPP
jgi:hypothetical protein